jgi:hypothetical protein
VFNKVTENNKNSQNTQKETIKQRETQTSSGIILIITVARMMDSKALLEVQMGLLHPLVDRPHL